MYAQKCVMHRGCTSFFAILILTFGLLPFVGAQAQQPERFVAGELLVGYATEADRDKGAKALSARKKKFILPGRKKAKSLTVTPMSGAAMKLHIELPRSLRRAVKKDPAVELKILEKTAENLRQSDERISYAHPNWIFSLPQGPKLDKRKLQQLLSAQADPPKGPPNDPIYLSGYHWNYGPAPGGMNAVGAWKHTKGSERIVVALVGSGVLFDHIDIKGSGNVLPGYNFASKKGRGPDATDVSKIYLGTFRAGVIGAVGTNNGLLVSGINWRVSVLPIRIWGRDDRARFSDVGDGIRWASGLPVEGVPPNKHPADVIQLPAGFVARDRCDFFKYGSVVRAINAARANGSVIVKGAGDNRSDVSNSFPANCSGVISVAGHDYRGKLSPRSNFGNVTIMAPGGNPKQKKDKLKGFIIGPSGRFEGWKEDWYGFSGSWVAGLHVSGAIALALSAHPEWRGKPDLIAEKLRASARPVKSSQCPKPCGAGQLDAERLLQQGATVAAPAAMPEERLFEGSPPSTIRSAERGITMSVPEAYDQEKVEQLLSLQAALQSGGPNDPVYQQGLHWHYRPGPGGMNAVGAWEHAKGSERMVVAVLSTGMHFDHPDVKGSTNVLPGYNFDSESGRSPDATDIGRSSDGSHLAGTVGAVGTNNGRAMAGLNWRISILPVRIMGSGTSIIIGDLADAIRWASGLPVKGVPPNKHPANVINIGLMVGSPCAGRQVGPIIDAINAARRNGTVIVAPAGNAGRDVSGSFPANCPGVISVAAHDHRGRLTWYSNYGNVTIMAPGGDPKQKDKHGFPQGVWSIVKVKDKYGVWPHAGTPQAAAHVSGAIALALSAHPEWRGKPDLIAEKLRASARPVKPGACPKPCGPGQLDAERLVRQDATIAAPEALPPETPFGGPPPSTIRPDEREITMTPPDGARAGGPTGERSQRPDASARAALTEPSSAGFDGKWQLEDLAGTLDIKGEEWRHPEMGIADLLKGRGAANYEVQYRHNRGVICDYRIKKTSDGHRLILEPTNPTQPADFCPSGILPKVGS